MLALTLLLLAAPPEPTPTAMKEALDAIVVVTPFLSSPDAFRDPKNAPPLSRALDVLARLRHPFFTGRAASPTAVADLFGRQAQWARDDFAAKNTESARYRVLSLTQLCLGCHLRAPTRDFADVAGKVDGLQVPPLQQAALFATTRQFDRALALWRVELVRPVKVETELFDQLDGLRLAVRVAVQSRDDAGLVRDLIAPQLKRDGLPGSMKRELAGWQRDAQAWAKERFPRDTQTPAALVNRARTLVEDSGALTNTAPAIDRFVALVRAESYLDEALRQAPDGEQRGEALFLLGVVHASVSEGPLWQLEWLYLEACIRENPATPRATACASRLKDRVWFTWRTRADIPAATMAALGELMALAQPSK